MEITYNKETGKKTWHLEKWYQKTYYVIGILSFWYIAVAFALGFVIGIIGEI